MIIYKITNKINNKVYIGQTINSLRIRWKDHCCNGSKCTALHNAIVKYGRENFTVEQIDVACSRDELDAKEQYWIKFYNSLSPNGYNLQTGGLHHEVSEETRRKLKLAKIGKNNPFYGKHLSVEARKKISERHKGERHYNYGKHLSEEIRLKMSKANSLEKHPNARRIICIETGEIFECIKIAEKKIGKGNIYQHLKGKSKFAGGYHWKYADEN